MKAPKINKTMLALVFIVFLSTCSLMLNEKIGTTNPTEAALTIAVPTGGNAWVMNKGVFTATDLVTSDGIRNWNNPDHTIRTFFYVEQAGAIALGLRAKTNTGTSKIQVNYAGKTQDVTLTTGGWQDIRLESFLVDQPGYYFVDLKGLEKDGATYAEVASILLGGVEERTIKYAKDDFYFARRGPSCHLNFTVPVEVREVEWFYSEIMVPKGQDVVGSYFMANGFGEGYFGIQVNSPTERRVLFSIWSPYQTDNPDDIPEDYKIKLLKKGAGVTTGEFGNEGSGGQSYKVFNWKTDLSYGFLIGAKPTGNGSTDYTAYFHDPAEDKWNLIAQFRRPKTDTYLKHLYSFLENFIPEQGVFARRALYKNQWAYDATGWHKLTEVTFTADNTARKEYRLDYSGGIEKDGFYLKNCGFTNDKVLVDSKFQNPGRSAEPKIDFSKLE